MGLYSVSVLEPVVIVSHPIDTKANEGSLLVLKVKAGGSGPFSYQWFHNGQSIEGASDSQYRILQVEDSHRGTYEVDVTNVAGTIRSSPAELRVVLPPKILFDAESFGNEGDPIALRIRYCG